MNQQTQQIDTKRSTSLLQIPWVVYHQPKASILLTVGTLIGIAAAVLLLVAAVHSTAPTTNAPENVPGVEASSAPTVSSEQSLIAQLSNPATLLCNCARTGLGALQKIAPSLVPETIGMDVGSAPAAPHPQKNGGSRFPAGQPRVFG